MSYKPSHIPNFRAKLAKLAPAARAALTSEVSTYAESEKEEFVSRIKAQRFASFKVIFYPENGTNLSPRWLAFKELHGLDMRTMIATGTYVSKIRVFSHAEGAKKRVWKIGFAKTDVARDKDGHSAGITLDHLALIHEHGSAASNIPARPHWKPNLNRMKREAPAKRKAIAEKVVSVTRTAIELT